MEARSHEKSTRHSHGGIRHRRTDPAAASVHRGRARQGPGAIQSADGLGTKCKPLSGKQLSSGHYRRGEHLRGRQRQREKPRGLRESGRYRLAAAAWPQCHASDRLQRRQQQCSDQRELPVSILVRRIDSILLQVRVALYRLHVVVRLQLGTCTMKRREQGLTTVEFAVVATALFTMLFGVIEFSREMYSFAVLSV